MDVLNQVISPHATTLYDVLEECETKTAVGHGYGSLADHSNIGINSKFTQRLKDCFDGTGVGYGKELAKNNELGMGTIKFHPHSVDLREGSTVRCTNGDDADGESIGSLETGVWLVSNPVSSVFKEEIIREVNLLPFIGSSQDVGANTKIKSRYYRVSTKSPSGGLFQLSSDPSLIECSPMQDVEKKLVDLVSSVMEEQDKIIAEANPGVKMCRWVHDKTMCQLTAGTLKDSAYGVHTDCGFHHNHNMQSFAQATTQFQQDCHRDLPSDELMRVVTLVLSTADGSNAKLVFTDPSEDNREVFSINTTDNCMHIQNFGCQRYLRHQVIPASPSVGKVDEVRNENGVRLVFSFRYSIDNRDKDLMSALLNADEKLSKVAAEVTIVSATLLSHWKEDASQRQQMTYLPAIWLMELRI